MVAGASSVASPLDPLFRPMDAAPSIRALRVLPAGFDAIAREHMPAVQAFALRLCGTQADAHDLAQDCLERALRRFHTLAPGSNARAWMLTILHNAFIDRCRRRTAEKRADDIDAHELSAPEPAEPPAWTRVTAEDLHAAVARLDEEFRAVYRLHVEGRSYQEIASQLGIPVNTVGTRLSRARAKLRTLLEASLAEGKEASR
jgi:RNA polymerase sigma-70 factor (ECF subfamily)